MEEQVCKCGEKALHTASTSSTVEHFCCKCWVEQDNPPSDWHPLCMETYNAEKKKQIN